MVLIKIIKLIIKEKLFSSWEIFFDMDGICIIFYILAPANSIGLEFCTKWENASSDFTRR
jgi:hypothetical protein